MSTNLFDEAAQADEEKRENSQSDDEGREKSRLSLDLHPTSLWNQQVPQILLRVVARLGGRLNSLNEGQFVAGESAE